MKNREVADRLYEIADFLEMKDVDYKPRAYRRAAREIESLSGDIGDFHNRGELEEIEGVGENIAEKIAEFLETGEMGYYQQLKEELPLDIEALTSVEGLGPKSVKKLYDELGITDLEELERAAEEGEIAEVEGFGEKTQEKILDTIEQAKTGQERMLLGKAFPIAREIKQDLKESDRFNRVTIVGSFRRRRPTVGDIDILATADDRMAAMKEFTSGEDVKRVLVEGETKSSIVTSGELQVDLRIVDEESYGAAKQYFTGSKDHNVTVRTIATRKDWKLNEYGLFDADENRLAGETEEGVYRKLQMDYIEPELREDTGEVEAAQKGNLPKLVKQEDIRGDLQMHTGYSDGKHSVQEMAEKAEEMGYEYILVTDHGPSLHVTGGPNEEELEDQAAEIREVNKDVDLEVLQGVEANIDKEGELDISREKCEELDLVVIALHDRVDNPTKKIVSAMDNYPVDILAHPQNRMINQREGLDMDMDRIVEVAAQENVALEINSQPGRLDLDWMKVKEYRGDVKFVVSTDAHTTGELEYMHLGVAQARRGWCEKRHVLNTGSLEKLRSYFG